MILLGAYLRDVYERSRFVGLVTAWAPTVERQPMDFNSRMAIPTGVPLRRLTSFHRIDDDDVGDHCIPDLTSQDIIGKLFPAIKQCHAVDPRDSGKTARIWNPESIATYSFDTLIGWQLLKTVLSFPAYLTPDLKGSSTLSFNKHLLCSVQAPHLDFKRGCIFQTPFTTISLP